MIRVSLLRTTFTSVLLPYDVLICLKVFIFILCGYHSVRRSKFAMKNVLCSREQSKDCWGEETGVIEYWHEDERWKVSTILFFALRKSGKDDAMDGDPGWAGRCLWRVDCLFFSFSVQSTHPPMLPFSCLSLPSETNKITRSMFRSEESWMKE
jgi:hypothetical protein